MNGRSPLFHSIFAVLLGLALHSLPGASANCLSSALDELSLRVSQDTSVELELEASGSVLSLIEPKGGTLRGLLPHQMISTELALELSASHSNYDSFLDIPWRDLSSTLKKQVIDELSARRGIDFFDNRTLMGFQLADQVQLKFDQRTTLLGKTFEPGVHQVKLSDYMKHQIEYTHPNDLSNLKGIELHFRKQGPAGDVSNDAWKLLHALGIPRNHQHVHVVALLPEQALRADPTHTSIQMADFVKRANLMAEMMDIVHDGGSITSVVEKSGNIFSRTETVSFNSMSSRDLMKLADSLYDLGKQDKNKPTDTSLLNRFKMMWVGFRGPEKYDRPDVYGLEVRSIRATSNPERINGFLNTLQERMEERNWPLTREQARNWKSKNDPKDLFSVGELLGPTWYNRPPDVLREEATPIIKKRIGAKDSLFKKNPTYQMLKHEMNGNTEIKMLIHNWATDPVFGAQPELLKQIEKAQLHAIDRLEKVEGTLNQIMKEFLLESGLYEATTKSLGLTP